MKAIGFDTSRVERGRRPRKKAAALLLQTRRLQSYPSAFMVGSESWLLHESHRIRHVSCRARPKAEKESSCAAFADETSAILSLRFHGR